MFSTEFYKIFKNRIFYNTPPVAASIFGSSLMYSRKSVGPTTKPSGTPALMGYSCEDFHQEQLKAIRPNNWPEIPQHLCLWRKPACQALDMSSTTATIVSDLLNVSESLSDATCRRSAADRESMKAYWKSEKRLHLSRRSIDQSVIITRFSMTLLTT